MPTTRPRHFVTETDELSVALDDAETRWPGLSRSQILIRLALEGSQLVQRKRDEHRDHRLAVLHQHSGMLTGTYGPDYLKGLRQDWPE